MKLNSHSKKNSRGVALIVTLLLLSLFTVMTLAMVIATTSDTLIDGYYRNFRGSFYASDSGLNAARQYLANQVYAAVPTTYTPSSGSPTFTTSANTMLTNLESSASGFGAYQSILGSQTSWPGLFKVDSTSTNTWLIASGTPAGSKPTCTPMPGCNTPGTSSSGVTQYTYTYPYQLTVIGESRTNEQNTVTENGNILLTITLNPSTSTTTSFASYGTLLDQYAICSGAFVPGTMSGQMFSNQSWNFGAANVIGSTKYIFNGNVGAVNADVGYMYSDGTCDQKATTSDSHSGSTISPTFNGGLSLGQTAIPLPSNTYNQLSAVLDGLGDCPPAPATCSAPTNAAMGVLVNAAGSAWTSAATSGVYMPYTSTTVAGVTTKTLNSNAGGLYIQGNVSQMTLKAATATVSGSTHNEQVFTIVQGAVTTTVTLDLTGNTTRIQDTSGHDTGAMSGLPTDLNYSPATEDCLVYVAGNISSNLSATAPTGLSGPSSGAAIQNGSGVTVVSTGGISITGSLTYTTEPVSLSVADTPVSPAPTNVLGIFTGGGNVQLQPPSNITTMEIDASIATMASGQSYGIQATWNTITNVNIVGGRVQNKALNGSSVTARNIYYDQRFSNGFAPPWFPTTTVTSTTTNTAVINPPTINRVSWTNKTSE